MYETLKRVPPDSILKLIDLYRADANPDKVDLGVGVYQDEAGETPILTAIKKAEAIRHETETTKTYFSPAGDPQFAERISGLILGDALTAIGTARVRLLQTPGGSGALRVAGELIRRASPTVTIWTSSPTWANHAPLLSATGMQLEGYPYYDNASHAVLAEAMLSHLEDRAEAGDIVLLHGSCHNPTGADLSEAHWADLTALCTAKGLIPFIDIAYHGFALPISDDLKPVRRLLAAVPEAMLAYSCSKNFGLYRDRVGALLILGRDQAATQAAFSNAYHIVRTMYSVPPHHGAALVSSILSDDALEAEWLAELDVMRDRLTGNRQLLADALGSRAVGDFHFLKQQYGMFSLLGISQQQAARLVSDYSIYLPENGRINLAGIKPGNVAYVADSIARIMT